MHPRDAVCGARDASPMGGYTRSVAITAGRVACAVDPSSSSSSVTPSAMRDARCAVRDASSSSSSSSSSVGRQHRRRARDTNARASSELDASDGRAAPRWFFFWCCADRRSHLARTSLADALGVHARRRRRRRTKTTNQPSHAFAAVRSRVYDVDETRGLI